MAVHSSPYVDYILTPNRPCAVVAHRGAWQKAPENSLLSFENAISAGYDVIEIDVRRSDDGGLFLLHDDTLHRMAGVSRIPETMTLAELTKLKLRDRDGGEDRPFTDDRLPALRDVFELTRGRIFIDLDIKDMEVLPEVVACAKAMGVADQVDVKADLRTREDLAWIRDVAISHGVPFMAKTDFGAPDAEAQIALLFELAPFMVEISFTALDQVSVLRSRLREAGIALWYNSLDDVSSAGFTDTAALSDPEAIWGSLIDAGISAIQTDHPSELARFAAERSDLSRTA